MASKQNINASNNLYIVPVLDQFINTAFHSFSTLKHLKILEVARGALNQAECLPKLAKMDKLSTFSSHPVFRIISTTNPILTRVNMEYAMAQIDF